MRIEEDLNERGGRAWLDAMGAGDFERAWRQSDATHSRNTPDPHRFWQGEKLDGKRLMVRSLHGFGDAVQMLRYAPCLAEITSETIYEVAPRFVPLAPFIAGVRNVITWGVDAPTDPPSWDVQIEVMELPYLFRTTLSELPLAERYLEPPSLAIDRAGTQMRSRDGSAGLPRVGLVWAAGEWNPSRSIPWKLLSRILTYRDISFWSLQGGKAALEATGALHDATQVCGDGLLRMAATIAHLDLVITVDTLAAHLAGAMGKRVWVMLQHEPDWRWMVGREDSPWYPTMKLFRQAEPLNWHSVISLVEAELRHFG